MKPWPGNLLVCSGTAGSRQCTLHAEMKTATSSEHTKLSFTHESASGNSGLSEAKDGESSLVSEILFLNTVPGMGRVQQTSAE